MTTFCVATKHLWELIYTEVSLCNFLSPSRVATILGYCNFVPSIACQDADERGHDDSDEEGQVTFVLRDQQLRSKATKKEGRGKGKRGGGRGGKARKGKRGKGKGKNAGGKHAKRISKKRSLLTGASATEKDHDQKPRKRRTKTPQPEAAALKNESESIDAKKVATRGRRKKDAEGLAEEPSVSGAKALPKGKAKAKAKAKAVTRAPKAKAKSRGRRNVSPEEALLSDPLRSDPIVKALMDFASQFPAELEMDGNHDKMKEAMNNALQEPLNWCALNKYWTRNAAGVKILAANQDVHHFSFNFSTAASRHKLAVALRCAELAVSWLSRERGGTRKAFLNKHILKKDIHQSDTFWWTYTPKENKLTAYCYISCYIYV